jgi:hypothetical protein
MHQDHARNNLFGFSHTITFAPSLLVAGLASLLGLHHKTTSSSGAKYIGAFM